MLLVQRHFVSENHAQGLISILCLFAKPGNFCIELTGGYFLRRVREPFDKAAEHSGDPIFLGCRSFRGQLIPFQVFVDEKQSDWLQVFVNGL